VRALIDKEGNVVAANLIKGLSNECNKSALDAIVKAKFIPASLNGKSVGAQVSIPIMFKLN
jgi:TonB family protein